jgi:hypothetical protein
MDEDDFNTFTLVVGFADGERTLSSKVPASALRDRKMRKRIIKSLGEAVEGLLAENYGDA